ncbi:MAG: hypothetical protein ACK4F9_04085 [Brevinematia bacterium]
MASHIIYLPETNTKIYPNFSIFKKKVSNSFEAEIKGTKIWIYENTITTLPKKTTIKQIKFLSDLTSLFINQKSNPYTHKLNSSYSEEIIKRTSQILNPKNKSLHEESPIKLVKKFLKENTLDFLDTFTISFFYFSKIHNNLNTENLEYYLQNYKNLISSDLKFFKILMKKDIVSITNNIFGDSIIHLNLPIRKTCRNMKVFKGNSYLIPLDKIDIFDLSIVYYLSSSFKIQENVAIGKLSKTKIQNIKDHNTIKDFANILSKLNFYI